MKIIFAKSNDIVMRYVRMVNIPRNDYRYVFDLRSIMGIHECEIILLHGWCDADKGVADEVFNLLRYYNCKLTANEPDVPQFIWKELRAVQHRHYKDTSILYKERKMKYLTKFDILDV